MTCLQMVKTIIACCCRQSRSYDLVDRTNRAPPTQVYYPYTSTSDIRFFPPPLSQRTGPQLPQNDFSKGQGKSPVNMLYSQNPSTWAAYLARERFVQFPLARSASCSDIYNGHEHIYSEPFYADPLEPVILREIRETAL